MKLCFYKGLFVAFMVTTYLGYNVLFFPGPQKYVITKFYYTYCMPRYSLKFNCVYLHSSNLSFFDRHVFVNFSLFFDFYCTSAVLSVVKVRHIALATLRKCQINRCQKILTASPWRTVGDNQYALVLHGWRLSSKTWNPKTSPWMKQLMWLKSHPLWWMQGDHLPGKHGKLEKVRGNWNQLPVLYCVMFIV